MSFVKALLFKIGRFFLSVVRVLSKAICCRRKKQENEYLLPMTVSHVVQMEKNKDFELQSWDTWNESENSSSSLNSGGGRSEDDQSQKISPQEDSEPEDYFKDMVPEIKKPRKLIIREVNEEGNRGRSTSNRLAMDPKAVLTGPDLGLIDDNPSTWEDSENMEELMPWDPDTVIKEKKRAEREKRLAEHQRRKQEKENLRASKHGLVNKETLKLSDTKEKPKYS